MIFHPLDASTHVLPERMNNPFYYKPDALCRAAASEVQREIAASAPEFKAEIDQGKMFGVLIVKKGRDIGYLSGYSGQINGRSDWPGFVPAVFDYLQPNGYFKEHEAMISALNERINALENSRELEVAKQQWHDEVDEAEREIEAFKVEIKREKEGRPQVLTPEMIRRSQFLKAELHRKKKQFAQQIAEKSAMVEAIEADINALKTERHQRSDALQRWLFSHFLMLDDKGNQKNLLDIFYPMVPPAGSGECCEPKLLQYAFRHQLQPISMAMFWWGASPREEIRHHLQYYPACNGKCKPILRWMLHGIEVETNPLEQETHQTLEWIYEDNDIAVVCKPAGMLSVPGKNQRESVRSLVLHRHPEATGPQIVHRLDMATSGLLVVALNVESYINLQQQFKQHHVEKQYVALLSVPHKGAKHGQIRLPLRPDLTDRPRQIVDKVHGKEAVTDYQFMDDCRVKLYPRTGRTHQLRMHCAHVEGLNNPIRGDELYGTGAQRLFLHAEELAFDHPKTGKRLHFERQAPF